MKQHIPPLLILAVLSLVAGISLVEMWYALSSGSELTRLPLLYSILSAPAFYALVILHLTHRQRKRMWSEIQQAKPSKGREALLGEFQSVSFERHFLHLLTFHNIHTLYGINSAMMDIENETIRW